MANIINTLTQRIEEYRKENKNPCKNYATQEAAEKATAAHHHTPVNKEPQMAHDSDNETEGDVWRAHRAHVKEQRQKKADANVAELKQLGVTALVQSENVLRVNTERGPVMYYPPSGKWQHRGKTMRGTAVQFRDWLSSMGFL